MGKKGKKSRKPASAATAPPTPNWSVDTPSAPEITDDALRQDAEPYMNAARPPEVGPDGRSFVGHRMSEALGPVAQRAFAGEAEAQFQFGEAYMRSPSAVDRLHLVGQAANEPNKPEASRLFAQAAAQGHAGAQYALGRLCEDRGADAEAARWFERAADGGHEIAREWRARRATRVCANCGAYDKSNKQCAGCLTVAFCGAECQREFWPRHKATCKALRAAKAEAARAERAAADADAAILESGADTISNTSAFCRITPNHVSDDAHSRFQYQKMLGDRHFKDGDLDGALAHYSSAVGVWDGVAEAHRSANESVMAACLSNRSLVRHKQADHEAALADAERALDVDATFAKAHLRAAAALDALGRGDDAAERRRAAARLVAAEKRAKAERPRVAALGGAADRDDDAFADLTDGRDPLDAAIGKLAKSHRTTFGAPYDFVVDMLKSVDDRALARAVKVIALEGQLLRRAAKCRQKGDQKTSVACELCVAAADLRLARHGRAPHAVLNDWYDAGRCYKNAKELLYDILDRADTMDRSLALRAYELGCGEPQLDPHGDFHFNVGLHCRNQDRWTDAAALWGISCDRGNGDAMGELSRLLLVGAPGVPADRPRCLDLFRRAEATVGRPTGSPCCDYRIKQMRHFLSIVRQLDARGGSLAVLAGFYGNGRDASLYSSAAAAAREVRSGS
jgi:tetratricopeptide (TPR) repeat protein